MIKIIIATLLGITFFTGDKKEDNLTQNPLPNVKPEIPFTGVWTRQFEAGPDNLHTVSYYVSQNSIRYTLAGPIGNVDYQIERDTFLLENNRFIGHTSANQHYVMFIKNITKNSISIYKQKITDIEQGMGIEVPSATTTENHGWNTYQKTKQ